MKKYLTKFLFIFAIVFCFTITISAQKEDNDKKAVRKPPTIIVPGKKESPNNDKSKDNDKESKKSAKVLIYFRTEVDASI